MIRNAGSQTCNSFVECAEEITVTESNPGCLNFEVEK